MALIFEDLFAGAVDTLLSSHTPDLTVGPLWLDRFSDARAKLDGGGHAVPGASGGIPYIRSRLEFELTGEESKIEATVASRFASGDGQLRLRLYRLSGPDTTLGPGIVEFTTFVENFGGHLTFNNTVGVESLAGVNTNQTQRHGSSDSYVIDSFHVFKLLVDPSALEASLLIDGVLIINMPANAFASTDGLLTDWGVRIDWDFDGQPGSVFLSEAFGVDMGTDGPTPPGPPPDFWTNFVNTREVA
ncbi:hypothetical protein [Variovorax paradoxus]|uniref:hypothetical protein n=1 Tax=Variovorax paradoxus TaxID=34073 RepID=UPI00193267FC|nr:hypothetical protein INQ48_13985 [Variovorax paradoxus]